MAETLKCSTCQRMLPAEVFYRKRSAGGRGRAYRCKECSRERNAAYAAAHRLPAGVRRSGIRLHARNSGGRVWIGDGGPWLLLRDVVAIGKATG